VLDVDGTMVDRDLVISERLKRAAARVRETGGVITIATGRMLRSARRFALTIGANGPATCYQGAVTFLPENGRIVRHRRLGPDEARAALAAVDGTGAQVNVYIDDEIWVTTVDEWAAGYAQRMETELHVVESLQPLAERRPTLVLAVAEPATVAGLTDEVRSRLGDRVMVTRSLPHFCEIADSESGKDRAVAAIAATMGIDRKRVAAFGDGEGDTSMLAWAGLGVAVEDGHPDALAAGDIVAPRPADDGVAKMLEDLLAAGLIGR